MLGNFEQPNIYVNGDLQRVGKNFNEWTFPIFDKKKKNMNPHIQEPQWILVQDLRRKERQITF